jgi:hypothetical protein
LVAIDEGSETIEVFNMVLIFSPQEMIRSLKQASGELLESTCYDNNDKPSIYSCSSKKNHITGTRVRGGWAGTERSGDKTIAKTIKQSSTIEGYSDLQGNNFAGSASAIATTSCTAKRYCVACVWDRRD